MWTYHFTRFAITRSEVSTSTKTKIFERISSLLLAENERANACKIIKSVIANVELLSRQQRRVV